MTKRLASAFEDIVAGQMACNRQNAGMPNTPAFMRVLICDSLLVIGRALAHGKL